MKVLMAASECVPFVKVGGLADVVGTLPRFLKAKRHDIRVIIPKYRQVNDAAFALKTLPFRLRIPVGNRFETAVIKEGRIDNVPVYFVENTLFFDRPEVYRTQWGDYPDNRERFVFFSRAVLEAAKALDFQPDILHCHDWQTGILPAYLKTAYQLDAFFIRTATVYTIHNIAYQGMFGADTIGVAGFPAADFTWDKLEYYGKFNFMKTGIVYADAVSTVSPTYAKEILLTEEGRGMEGVLRARRNDVFGILNGIDYTEWNPAFDHHIAATFSREDYSAKALCKEDLQRCAGLPENKDAFVIGAVSRLDPQKGYTLVVKAIPEIIRNNVQIIVLGTGDKDIQELLAAMAQKYPDKVSFLKGFNNPLAHKVYAGSDAFIMPSQFEPCGLGQMIALAYGTIPVVHETGGLADSITEFNAKTGKGNGFSYVEQKPGALADAALKA